VGELITVPFGDKLVGRRNHVLPGDTYGHAPFGGYDRTICALQTCNYWQLAFSSEELRKFCHVYRGELLFRIEKQC